MYDMKLVYIVAIAVGSLILLLLIICFYVIAKRRKQEEELRAEQEAVYSDPALAKMEYDTAAYDITPRPAVPAEEKQVTIEDVIEEGRAEKGDAPLSKDAFGKPDDGMEEISGHYEPEE
mgnify:FL=1